MREESSEKIAELAELAERDVIAVMSAKHLTLTSPLPLPRFPDPEPRPAAVRRATASRLVAPHLREFDHYRWLSRVPVRLGVPNGAVRE